MPADDTPKYSYEDEEDTYQPYVPLKQRRLQELQKLTNRQTRSSSKEKDEEQEEEEDLGLQRSKQSLLDEARALREKQALESELSHIF